MSIIGSNILAGASGQGVGGYTIETSLRLRSSASAYLSRTPASAGNRKTWTWSGWVKRGEIGVAIKPIFVAADTLSGSSNRLQIDFQADDTLRVNHILSGTVTQLRITTQVFRDVSAWYHLVFAFDTTEATADNRLKIYVNGIQITTFSTSNNFSQNTDSFVNKAVPHGIGIQAANTPTYFDGYLTEINFIDGQALDASSFGEYNADTGVWQPIAYAGTYGTNGFYLPFSDATTTTTLGADSSGNGNDWTTHNISLTAGATYDSMTDTPTPYADGGNYATWNPLRPNAAMSYSNANLSATSNGGSGRSAYGTFGMSSGKWYFETTGNDNSIGVATVESDVYAIYTAAGSYNINGTTTSGKATYTTTDIIAIAYDADANTIEFFKNNVSQGSTSFAAGAGLPVVAQFNGTFSATRTCVANFGQRPFAYTPPTGFKALHTGNLPDSSIVDGSKYFDVLTYTGDGTSSRSITGLEFQPDFSWLKSRSEARNHTLYDAVRGAGSNKALSSSTTDPEGLGTVAGASASFGYVSSLDSDGFSVSAGSTNAAYVNINAETYVAWNWKANGTGVTNTDGSITSTVSANPTAGFSVVSYTGTGSAATVGHGLGVAPDMVIVKKRSDVSAWLVYHSANTSAPATDYLELNTTSATVDNATVWNDTEPTSSVFSIGTAGAVNANTATYVAYCFAEVESYSKFGSYLGNGSDDGTFVYLGFRPAFLMVKRTNNVGNWKIFDNRLNPYNVANNTLAANLSNAETIGSTGNAFDIVSNGFKARGTATDVNASANTYIYMAFAENPFKNSLAR